jgi:hypothetical protein
MLPHPSPPANLGKMAIRAVLWRVLYVFLTSEKTKKGNGSQFSFEYIAVG